MTMSPEVVGALVGVAGLLSLSLIGNAIRGFVNKNSGNGKVHHCADHYTIVEHIAEVRQDVKWIREHLEKKGHGSQKY